MSDLPIEILYIDDEIIAINKPSGLRTLPDGFHPELAHVRFLLEPNFGRLWIVHRLDKETSGVLLLARSEAAHRALNDQFVRREIKKEYHAICAGSPNLDQWEIDLPLRIDGDRKHRTIVDFDNGKTAATYITVRKRSKSGNSLLSARPQTGYTHQIRAHLAACDLPIVGDRLYSTKPNPAMMSKLQVIKPKQAFKSNRLGLHAYQISFIHPVSHKECFLLAPYPDDFSSLLDQLN